jgi:hypothetical protein
VGVVFWRSWDFDCGMCMYSPLGFRKCWEEVDVFFMTVLIGVKVAFRSGSVVCEVRGLGGIGRPGLGTWMSRKLGTVRWDFRISRRWFTVCPRSTILVISGFFSMGRVSMS